MGTELNSQIERYLHRLSEEGVPPLYRLSVAEARETYRRLCVADGEPPPVGDVADRTVPGPVGDVPIRVYRPEGDREESRPAVAFFHGGGWVLGGLDTHDLLCRELATASGRVVVAVDYRLAPEHRFPAGLEDCYAATRWLAAEAATVGVDPDAIAVAGDSAGATLAAGVTLLARDRGGPEIESQALAYPVANYAFDTDSYEENASGYFLTRKDMERFWDAYLPSDADGRHPYASPLLADDLGGLPPAFVATCGYDPLRDDGRAYARRLEAAGVPVRRAEYDDAIHGFLTMLDDPAIDRAEEAIEGLAAALADAPRGRLAAADP